MFPEEMKIIYFVATEDDFEMETGVAPNSGSWTSSSNGEALRSQPLLGFESRTLFSLWRMTWVRSLYDTLSTNLMVDEFIAYLAWYLACSLTLAYLAW